MSLGIVPAESGLHQGIESRLHQRGNIIGNSHVLNALYVADFFGSDTDFPPGAVSYLDRYAEIRDTPYSILGADFENWFHFYYNADPFQSTGFNTGGSAGPNFGMLSVLESVNGQKVFKSVADGGAGFRTCGYTINSTFGSPFDPPGKKFVTLTGWNKHRYRPFTAESGFNVMGYVWARNRLDAHGWDQFGDNEHTRITFEGATSLGNYTAAANEWVYNRIDLIDIFAAPPGSYEGGLFAKIIISIVHETQAEWSARTGISL